MKPTLNVEPSTEESRHLHARMHLNLNWKDLAKLALMGNKIWMSLCVRINLVKDDKGRLVDIDVDPSVLSTRIVVTKPGEDYPMSEAVFPDSYDQLHKGET